MSGRKGGRRKEHLSGSAAAAAAVVPTPAARHLPVCAVAFTGSPRDQLHPNTGCWQPTSPDLVFRLLLGGENGTDASAGTAFNPPTGQCVSYTLGSCMGYVTATTPRPHQQRRKDTLTTSSSTPRGCALLTLRHLVCELLDTEVLDCCHACLSLCFLLLSGDQGAVCSCAVCCREPTADQSLVEVWC